MLDTNAPVSENTCTVTPLSAAPVEALVTVPEMLPLDVSDGTQVYTRTSSSHQPQLYPLLSSPIRHRNRTLCPDREVRFSRLDMYPWLSDTHADRPLSGLPTPLGIVPPSP